ncbi:MAG: hypothetical protein C0618_01690 [Desulfuromonas sp.]|nr:MAG: hypothetical protein C0618_01690 [Desulfuromonas sp.]
MTTEGFDCRQCGHCCLNLKDAYSGCVDESDLKRWIEAGRDDLLVWVETLRLSRDNILHRVWVDPETGDDVERCPWLLDRLDRRGFLCGIDEVKPGYCRAFPDHAGHAKMTGCPGYDDLP